MTRMIWGNAITHSPVGETWWNIEPWSFEFANSMMATMWGPRSIAKLVHITPITIWFMVLITIVTGANLNQQTYNWGGHIVGEIIPKFLHITRIPLWFSVGNPVAMDQPTGSSTDFPNKLVPPYLATFFLETSVQCWVYAGYTLW